jgi:hypothetical protein
MSQLNEIWFSVSDILIQDGNTEEYKIGQRYLFELDAHPNTPLEISTKKKIYIEHIAFNTYKV